MEKGKLDEEQNNGKGERSEDGEQREWRKGNWMKSRITVKESGVRMENRESGERGTG